MSHKSQMAIDAILFSRAVCKAKARWEPFTGLADKGEVCVGGLRYATELIDGVPVIPEALRSALTRAVDSATGKP